MLKRYSFRKIAIGTLFFLVALLLYSFPSELKKDTSDIVGKKSSNVYLVDRNDYVSLVKVSCDIDSNDIKGTFKLISDNTCLPTGFRTYIPNNTKLLNYSLDNGLLKLNFSKEFYNVKKGYEEKLIEMIIYSFTGIDGVREIMIFIEDKILNMVPNTDKKLPTILNRDYGINKVIDITTLSNNVSFNVYYLGKEEEEYYYIPVTYVMNGNNDIVKMIINKLKSNNINSSLLTHLTSSVDVVSYDIDDDNMSVIFNKELSNILFNSIIEEEVKYSLEASLADTFNVKNVNIIVNSQK